CAKGDFCVWSGKNGTGTRCAWNGNDPDWWGGAVQCNPHFLVSSYWNNGYKGNLDHVQVYIDTNYKTKLGKKISPGAKRTLWEGAPMRSHKWVN
ncbi:peptidase inhibitor family I36 protein, partial [Nocardiopsis gilva]